MKRKNSKVSFRGLHPTLIEYLFIIDEACRDYLGHELVVTSCTDGVHSETSSHYRGCAIDIRTWTTPFSGIQLAGVKRQGFFNHLKKVLGEDWFLLDEGTHFHTEWRPRRK